MKRFFCLSIAGMLLIIVTAAILPQINRLTLEKEIVVLQKQLIEKERSFIEPSAQDKILYSQFLTQPDSGIFRLLSRGGGSTQKLLTISGNGTYYSFARLTNEYGYGNDISLETGRLRMANGSSSMGLISLLGDIPLETVTMGHPSVEFLKNAMTGKDSPIRQVQRQSQNGFRQGEFTYTKEVVAAPNTTYVLRSVDPPGSDVLIALRVVRRDADGSVTIIWKKLKTYPAPVIER